MELEILSLSPSTPADPHSLEAFSSEAMSESQEWTLAAFLFFQKALSSMQQTLEESLIPQNQELLSSPQTSPSSEEETFPIASSDIFHFGYLWSVLKTLKDAGLLFDMISERKDEIRSIKEQWQEFIQDYRLQNPELYSDLASILESGDLIPAPMGAGSAYFLIDEYQNPRYVIKPIDEDIFCLNNHKHWASPFHQDDMRVRDYIPLYRSAQTDVLCYWMAQRCGLAHITPETFMAIIQDDRFYDLSENLSPEQLQEFLEKTGPIDKEKLCSVQEFITGSRDLYEVILEMQTLDYSDEEIDMAFDLEDFNDANLFLWLTYDTDAHPGNFRVYFKSFDAQGKPIYGIKKVDNGLSFPEQNAGFLNFLTYFQCAKQPLSEGIKEKIANIPVDLILQDMHVLQMDGAAGAFLQRVNLLQELAGREGMTTYEMNLRMMVLEMPDGEQIAYSSLSIDELVKLIEGETYSSSSTYSFSLDEDSETPLLPSLYREQA